MRVLIIASLLAASVGCATHHPRLESKVSRPEAERIALANVPGGAIKEGELEQEHGRTVWSFDIAVAGATDITEVQVDAASGEVVSIETENAEKQAAEKQKDAHEKR